MSESYDDPALRVGGHLIERLGESNGHWRSRGRHRVVIVGGGFGGLAAAQVAAPRKPLDVTVIDREPPSLPAAALSGSRRAC